MITPAYAQAMARYNKWQNENLYGCADRLTDDERKRDRGAFFGSIHKTLNHLLWGDRIWLHRFAGTPKPEGGIPDSVRLVEAWAELQRARVAQDAAIVDWAGGLEARWLEGDLTYYSGAAKRDITKPKWVLVTHFFNHQTHHRGQVHCMLTQSAQKPGATDLVGMPS